MKQSIQFAKTTYAKWSEHEAPRLGASLAFYSILSFAPLLVLTVAVVALVFGTSHAQSTLISEARQLIGDGGAETVQSLLKNAQKPSSGIVSSSIAFITLLFGASGVFTELRAALDIMWETKRQEASGVLAMIKGRLFSFGMVLSIGFLLLTSLLLSTALVFVGHWLGNVLPLPPLILEMLNLIFSLAVITVLFALMFKYIPAAKTGWREVLVGAVGTALLFTVGKFLLGLYLGKASVGSAYGAAGSLVAVVVWIYYSAQIFFFGAEFTHVYAEAHADTSPEPAKQNVDSSRPEPQVVAPGAIQTQSTRLAERPKAGAAAVDHAAAVLSSDPTPQRVFTLPSITPMSTKPVLARIPPAAPFASATKKSTPKLLIAVGFGFLLGRLFVGKQRDS